MSLKGSSDSIYSKNVKMMIFENDPNIEKAISSSWAHWLYIHLVGEWYTEWPFHFNLDPFHSFSDRVNIDYKGQCFRAIQGNLPKCPPDEKGSAGWNEIQIEPFNWWQNGDLYLATNIQDDSFWFVHKKSWIIYKSESVPPIELQFTSI